MDEVARYNLAFVSHFLCSSDNGRVLGSTQPRNASGHCYELSNCFDYENYDLLLERFLDEVASFLRKEKREADCSYGWI